MIEGQGDFKHMDDIENEVRKLICEILEKSTVDDVTNSDDLQELGLDSLNCIALIVDIEKSFDIEISDEQLGLQYVNNIDAICKLILNYLKS